MTRPHHGDPAALAARLDARLDARLATFTRYAATVSEQFSAALRGDADRARAIAEERELLGEHFAELRAVGSAGDGAPAFDALLAGAIEELDHQMGVELALRHRLAALRDEALHVLHVLHEPDAADSVRDGQSLAVRSAAAALAALDPAAVSSGALSSLVATADDAPAARPPVAYQPTGAARQLDVRF